MQKYRSYILPAAILLGLLLHTWCAALAFLAPYFIFLILLLNFSAVNIRELHISKLSLWIMLFQVVVSLGGYYLTLAISHNDILAQGVLIGVLCPVASSVVVIACMLGANRKTVTAYTIVGNIMVSIVAPLYFSHIGVQQDLTFWMSFLMILKKIGPTIALPFFVALALQFCLPKVNDFLSGYKNITFYIWAFLLFVTLGQTIDFIFINGAGKVFTILILGALSLLFCIIQFAVGKWMGKHYGDSMAGGQLLGQKNTAMGIWMANTFLNPLASVFLAFYSVWQNVFNSWQLWVHDKKQ